MVEIKVLDRLESERGNSCGVKSVERAVIGDIANRGGARVISNTTSAFAAVCDGVLYALADRLSAVEEEVRRAKAEGKTAVLFLSVADGSCGAPHTVFAYLDGMPILPRGAFDVKRLAPTLAQTVSDAVGLGVTAVDRLMRGDGVYGAIVGGKLAGFIGRSGTGGMDIFHVYDTARSREIGEELVKFLSTLVMTCGRIPFALVSASDVMRRAMLKECGLTEGELFAYVV